MRAVKRLLALRAPTQRQRRIILNDALLWRTVSAENLRPLALVAVRAGVVAPVDGRVLRAEARDALNWHVVLAARIATTCRGRAAHPKSRENIRECVGAVLWRVAGLAALGARFGHLSPIATESTSARGGNPFRDERQISLFLFANNAACAGDARCKNTRKGFRPPPRRRGVAAA
jgi:hypothetical protein